MYTSRGWARTGWFLLLATGLSSFVLDSMGFTRLLRGEWPILWVAIAEWSLTVLFMLTMLFLAVDTLRRKSQSLDPDLLVQLITPFMEGNSERKLPPSIYHLLQSLDVQRNMMRRCFQQAPFGVLFLSHNKSIIYANPVFLHMAGRAASELYQWPGDPFQSLFVPEEGHEDWLRKIDQEHGPLERSFGFLRQGNEELLPVLVTGFPLTDNRQAEPAGFILFLEDVSPTHQLRLLQHQHSVVLNSLHHGVVVIDLDTVITYANDSIGKMFNTEPAQLVGRSLHHAFPDELERACRLAQLALSTGEKQSLETTILLQSAGVRHIQITASPLKGMASASMGMLLVYQDRSAEVELQETMRRNDQLATVSQMAASIAHEVRNPMTSVQGFLQLMAREIEPTHAHSRYLQVMEDDLKRINEIITEYLSFSRMGNDTMEIVRLGTLLHNTYTLLLSEANLKGIQIELRLPDEDPVLIANPNRLKQVLINLARNSMEAMGEEGDHLLTLRLLEADDFLILDVQDTGPGISPDQLARIFNPFYTTKNTGTGLGLFISKKIIEEHHGTLQVSTELGVGTTFRILLPRTPKEGT